MSKIGVDIDGVIIDSMTTLKAYAELYDYCELHKKGLINRSSMKLGQRYDWTKEELKFFVDQYFVPLTSQILFRPLAIEILKMLVDEGNEIYIISNRGLVHEEAAFVIEEALYKNDVSISKYFWKTKDKLSVCLENDIEIMLDDDPDICIETSENGILTLYFREKNSLKLNQSNLLFDVDNFPEAYRVIKEYQKNSN